MRISLPCQSEQAHMYYEHLTDCMGSENTLWYLLNILLINLPWLDQMFRGGNNFLSLWDGLLLFVPCYLKGKTGRLHRPDSPAFSLN